MAQKSKSTIYWTKVDQQGRVVIPVEVRKAAGIEPGKPIAFVIEDSQAELMTVRQGAERAQKIAARILKNFPGRSLA
jgi:AbrB family looped-hinge helix DNA binding protein